jgi:hypothetical protein
VALDRSFLLLNVLPSSRPKIDRRTLQRLASMLANRPILLGDDRCLSDPTCKSELIHALLERVGGNKTALFIAPMNAEDLSRAFEELLIAHGNLYPLLQRRGFFAISPMVIIDDGVLLSGGSYSSVLLRVRGDKASIYKMIKNPHKERNIDADMRLLHEGIWLNLLPKSAARLFPQLKRLIDNGDEFGYEAEFVPSCSAAELIFQNCIDSDQLFAVLSEVYLALLTSMYCFPSVKLDDLSNEEDYLKRIDRRTRAILQSIYPHNGILRTLYNARRIIVNGVQCPSLFALLEHLRYNREWQPIVAPFGDQLCHGDLILEDILCRSDNLKKFWLVDPNPANHSALFDVAKTLLSLWIGYEFVYYDLFSIDECKVYGNEEICVTITFDRLDCQIKYAQTARLFLDFVKRRLSEYLGLDNERLESQLRMAAALHSLAIPMFHLLHHKRESRAVAFTCLGLYHASLALN